MVLVVKAGKEGLSQAEQDEVDGPHPGHENWRNWTNDLAVVQQQLAWRAAGDADSNRLAREQAKKLGTTCGHLFYGGESTTGGWPVFWYESDF
jgi:hypothetical protein